MRFLALALLLVSPALAAQPLAPEDSALVQKLLDISGTTQSAETMEQQFADMPMLGAFTDSLMAGFSPQMFVDSVRAAFERDFDREFVTAAIDALSDPAIRPLLDFQQSMGAGNDSELAQEITAVILNPDGYALADSATVQRLVDASGMTDQFLETMRTVMNTMMSAIPNTAMEAEAAGMSTEEYATSIMADQVSELTRTIVLGSRYAYRDVPLEAIDRLTDFYLSPVGRYYLDTAYAGTQAATDPMYARLGDFFSSMFSALEGETCEGDSVDCDEPAGSDD